MEMKTIPNYPNYGVTRDGRVWSYNRNRFMSLYVEKPGRLCVKLWVKGIRFAKVVHKLVFETFYQRYTDIVIHKDGDFTNNNLNNLIGFNRSVWNASLARKKALPDALTSQHIVQVDISNKEVEVINMPKSGTIEYHRIRSAVKTKGRRTVCSNGYLYFIVGEKQELIAEISARIKANQLYLNQVNHPTFTTCVKNHIHRFEKYLEVLHTI